jgi:hypothetical protein
MSSIPLTVNIQKLLHSFPMAVVLVNVFRFRFLVREQAEIDLITNRCFFRRLKQLSTGIWHCSLPANSIRLSSGVTAEIGTSIVLMIRDMKLMIEFWTVGLLTFSKQLMKAALKILRLNAVGLDVSSAHDWIAGIGELSMNTWMKRSISCFHSNSVSTSRDA